MSEQISWAQIFHFPKDISLAVERSHLFEMDIEMILKFQTDEIQEIDTISHLRSRLEFFMLTNLMSIKYPINFESIQAIHYIVELVSWYIRCLYGRLIIPSELHFHSVQIPQPDKFVLQYVFGLHGEDENFLGILRDSIEKWYLEWAELYERIPWEAGNDLKSLFTELANIVPILLNTIVKELVSYNESNKNFNRSIYWFTKNEK